MGRSIRSSISHGAMPMQANNFSLTDYLHRIDYTGTPTADIETVARMMRRQLFSVPFENLDVQAGKIVSLVPEEIVEKIVGRKRGGYCYEVNGLFAMALESLGIPYQFVAARPMFYPARRPRTHMALVLTLNGERWLCDLGFGSYGIRAPMRLAALDVEIAQDDDTFMITSREGRRPMDQPICVRPLAPGMGRFRAGQLSEFDASRRDLRPHDRGGADDRSRSQDLRRRQLQDRRARADRKANSSAERVGRRPRPRVRIEDV